ncbi:alpha/beta hydrolase [Mycobacteroides sp. LB1]|uniref:alpha/beta hydrolase n=1 Tax=Mycobacteroides sp. LB1 TaxID=2750814 RepID=UPI0015DE4DDB|nr:alpha/beta hydrolase [Mycobacteroides sp. LB1]
MPENVRFPSKGLQLAGNLYYPDNTDEAGLPAIVVGHPFGGVKEQTAGLYAQKLAEEGFVALTFDASYQGESEGEPRFLEDPFTRAEDVRSAVSFLTTVPRVDAERIGALGICASGGYVPNAAATDVRIKAVAAVSGADIGSLYRDGLGGGQSVEQLQQALAVAAADRSAEAQGAKPTLAHIVPEADEITADTPVLFAQGSDYYRTPRAQHPNSPNWYVASSIVSIAAYSSYDHVDLISPRPLLMIAGTEADTLYFSEHAIAKAGEPKELFLIEGATHIDLYDKPEYVDPAVEKLAAYFSKYL